MPAYQQSDHSHDTLHTQIAVDIAIMQQKIMSMEEAHKEILRNQEKQTKIIYMGIGGLAVIQFLASIIIPLLKH